MRKNAGTGFTEYYYGPNGSVQSEYNGSTWPVQYVYGGNRLIAEYTNSTTNFVHPDHLGSSRVVTGVNQSIVDNLDYYPFGLQNSGGTATTHKFTGKERDSESGLDDFGARYFGSNLGRFMTPDWASNPTPVPYAKLGNPQSLNLYAYLGNNPVSGADADGHDTSQHPVNPTAASMACITCEEDTSGGLMTEIEEQAVQQAPPPPPTPDPARVRTDPSLNPEPSTNSNSSATSSPADQTQAPMESRGQGGQGKGERRGTGKPDATPDPGKHARPSKDKPGQWEVKDPHTGKWVLKPPGWAPNRQQMIEGAAAIGTGYLIYRGVRMLPSLAPPLWWTIPENLAIP